MPCRAVAVYGFFTIRCLLCDVVTLARLALTPRAKLVAENLFLRKQLASISSCATTRPTALRGGAVVELEHAAEAFTAPNRAGADHGGGGRDAFIAQTLVRPFLMIVFDKRSYGSPEVSFAEWHHARQTLECSGR